MQDILVYEIPTQVPSSTTLWPTAVAAAFSTATVNAGNPTIPVGAAKVTGLVAVGANFKLVRNIDGYTTAPIALTSELANLATPKIWSLPLAPASVTRVPVTFGIASTRSGQTFTVAQNSSFALTSPPAGEPALRPILSYEDYALDNTPNFFDYFVLTALLDPGETFNLMVQTETGETPFSAGQVWVLDGWTAQGGVAGPLPAGTPGEFSFALKVPGSEPADALTLVSPSGSSHALIPSALSNITLDDFWHSDTPWITTETTWTLTLAYTGPLGNWSLTNGTSDHDWTLSLDVGNTTNYLREIKYQAKVRPTVLEISLSRWPFDTTPRLRLRQRDGSDFPVAAVATTEYTSLATDATAWISPAYSFQADTYIREGVEFWVYDEETGEESPYNSTNLINWFALPTPAGLTGVVNPTTGAITLQWPLGFAAIEGGFEIERRLSGDTAWQVIETVPARSADTSDLLHFTDPNPVVGKIHTYRVRYTYGSDPALHSAPSNLVDLTGWRDSDGDGIPDWWETLYGLLLDNADDASQISLGGGMTNLEKFLRGLNPTIPDTDGDGVDDPDDQHGLDPKRSEDIPVRYYGVIDLSESVDGPFPIDVPPVGINADGGTMITLNDAGRVAFAVYGTNPPGAPSAGLFALRSVVWENGLAVTDRTTLTETTSQPPMSCIAPGQPV